MSPEERRRLVRINDRLVVAHRALLPNERALASKVIRGNAPDTEFEYPEPEYDTKTTPVNIHSEGMAFYSLEQVPPAKPIALSIRFPNNLMLIRIIGDVAYCQPVPGKNFFKVGVKFSDINEHDQQKLKEYLDVKIAELGAD